MNPPQKDDQNEKTSMMKRVAIVGWIAIGIALFHFVVSSYTEAPFVVKEFGLIVTIGLVIIVFQYPIANLAVKEKRFFDKLYRKLFP